jgi:8-hydroxy-5-deazaflavin:NADPH oxidoreductase
VKPPVSPDEGVVRRLGIVGAGKMGTVLARPAIAGGCGVAISESGAADRIELIIDVLAPGARVLTTVSRW